MGKLEVGHKVIIENTRTKTRFEDTVKIIFRNFVHTYKAPGKFNIETGEHFDGDKAGHFKMIRYEDI